MDNSDGEGKGRKLSLKIRRSISSKGSTKSKKKEGRSQSLDDASSEPIEMLTPKQNGYADAEDGESDEEKMKHTASIKGMWKKAFKSLKSNDKQTWLSKKGSLIKRKDSEVPHDEEPEEVAKEIDPVYSLLKCAADLPKVPKTPKDAQCCSHVAGKGDSSGSTSKASSPSSSGVGHPLALPLQQQQHHHHHHHSSQYSIESISGGGSGAGPRATSPTITNRELMHHIVDESLGSEFRTFYKLTCPVKKHWNDGHPKKHSPNASFDHY